MDLYKMLVGLHTLLYVTLFGVIFTGMKRDRFKSRINVVDFN